MLKTIFVNGKFLAAPPTGVQRVAEELIRAVDALLGSNPELYTGSVKALIPERAARTLTLANVGAIRTGGLPTSLWEQVQLPWASRAGVSLNLCNMGPALSANAVTMIHDAQVHTTPQSYSKAFRLWYKLVQPILGRRHRLILTVSEYSRRQLAEYGVAPLEKIKVIPNGVDHVLSVPSDKNALSAFGLDAGAYVVGLATLQAHKNIRVLIEAFSDPRLKSVKLALFGGADRAAFEAALGAPLPDNVVLLGKISDGQLRALLEQALCFASPSTTEGFGLPIMEGMALGCPAVAAPCGALPEVCGDAALYADPHDAAAWAATFVSLKTDPALGRDLSRRGRARAALFRWEDSARLLLSYLSSLQTRPAK